MNQRNNPNMPNGRNQKYNHELTLIISTRALPARLRPAFLHWLRTHFPRETPEGEPPARIFHHITPTGERTRL